MKHTELDPDPYEELDEPHAGLGLIAGLWRSRWIIVLCTVAGIAFGLYMALSKPNVYVSVGKLLLRVGSREQRSPESAVQSDLGASAARSSPVRDEIHLLGDMETFKRAAREVGPRRILQPYDPFARDDENTPRRTRWLHQWQAAIMRSGEAPPAAAPSDPISPESILERAARSLAGATTISGDPATSVLFVGCKLSSPELAQAATAAVLRACQERHRDVFATTPQLKFVSEQLESAKKSAQQASEEFAQYRQQCDIYDLNGQRANLGSELNRLRSQLDADRTIVEQITTKLGLLEVALAETPELLEQPVPPQMAINPEYNALISLIRNLKEQLAGLSTEFTKGSPQYETQEKYLTGRIADLETDLAGMPRMVQVAEATLAQTPNPRREQLLQLKSDLLVERETLLVAIARRAETEDRLRDEIEHLLTCEPEHNRKLQDVQQKQARADQMLAAYNRAQTMGLIDREAEMSNLIVIQEASLPETKSSPNRAQILLFGTLLGLALGTLIALLRVHLDPHLRDPARVEACLGVPLLGVLPENRRWVRETRRARRRARQETRRAG